MHGMDHERSSTSGPHTAGATLHKAAQYDFFTRMLGLGVDGRNSRMVVQMAGIRPGDQVLDVGCGSGSLTLTAAGHVGPSGSVHGIDASPEMIRVARQKAEHIGTAATFRLGLIEGLGYPDASFDLVLCLLVIHHLPDDLKRRGFHEMYRVLKPGGQLFLTDFKPPAHPLVARLLSAVVGHAMMQSNVWAIPSLLAEAGFVEIVSGPTRAALLAFVRGRKPPA